MNTGLALKSFRASTALFSSASLARATPACHSARRLLTRHYSEEAAKSESEAKKEASNGEQSPVSEQEKLLQEKLKAKEAEVTDLTGRLRYLQADFLNLQRNSAREKEQTRDFAITKFASDLLETADVLALALKSVPPSALQPTSSDNSSASSGSVPETGKTSLQYLQELHSGVEITQRQLLQTLFKYHVKPFDPTGDKFDPNMHEALYQAPIPGKEPGTVLDCQKIGYMIKDRVLRAAQVGVVQDTS